MVANILNIVDRDKSIAEVCRLRDFTFVEGDTISPEIVAINPNISLYCLDDASRCAIFVELPPGVDLTESAFYHQSLFENAKHLVAVSYEVFHQLAADVPVQPENVIIIHTTGRAGSTLLHRVFNQLGSAVSLSEPDAFASVLYFRAADGSRDLELIELLRSSLAMTFRHLTGDTSKTCSFKLRNQAVEVIDLLYKAFPEAQHIFLYRNAIDFTSSFYRLFLEGGFTQDQPLEEVVRQIHDYLGRETDEVASFLDTTRDSVTTVERIALIWLLLMDRALRFYQQDIPILGVRYEDLNTERPKTVRLLFEYCELPPEYVEIGLRAFEHDAQEGTSLARANPQKGNALSLTPEQIAQVHAILARHPVIRTPDYVLPGTLQI